MRVCAEGFFKDLTKHLHYTEVLEHAYLRVIEVLGTARV